MTLAFTLDYADGCLFYDAVCRLDYIELKTGLCWIGEDLERNISSLIEILSRHLQEGGIEEKNEKVEDSWYIYILAEIRI